MIDIHTNFLDDALYNDTLNFAENVLAGNNLACQLTVWNQGVIGKSGPILIHKLDLKEPFIFLLREKINRPFSSVICYIQYFLQYSYIPWHDDGDHAFAGTLYLNKNWDREWGGAYMYEDQNKNIHVQYPEKNKLIIQHKNTWHSTTMVHPGADVRMSMQFFFKN